MEILVKPPSIHRVGPARSSPCPFTVVIVTRHHYAPAPGAHIGFVHRMITLWSRLTALRASALVLYELVRFTSHLRVTGP